MRLATGENRSCRHPLAGTNRVLGVVAILLGGVIAGCAQLGARTEGVSGPVAWQAADLRVVEWRAPGVEDPIGEVRETYIWALVLQETRGTPITFTHLAGSVTQLEADLGLLEATGPWSLQPHGTLRLPFSVTLYCGDVVGCGEGPALAPWYNLSLTGTTDQGQPVQLDIDLRLPPLTPERLSAPPQETGISVAIERRTPKTKMFIFH